MIIHFDGGLRKNMICIVNADSDYAQVEKRKYDNNDYEWDALEMALIHASAWEIPETLELVGDNNQVIRWIQEDKPICGDSIIKQKCLEKLTILRDKHHCRVIATWVKRNENLAGRVLEFHTSRSSQPISFVVHWFACSRCVFKSLSEKEKSEHFYNNHVTNG